MLQLYGHGLMRVTAVAPITLSEQWTGANGDPWNATRWPSGLAEATSLADIQGNEGRLLAQGAASAGVGKVANVTIGNFDLTMTFRLSTTARQYFQVNFRTTGNPINLPNMWPNSGYHVEPYVETSQFLFFGRIDSGVMTQLATPAKAWGTSAWNLRIQAIESAIKIKAWQQTEPENWDIEVTDATYSSGGFTLAHSNGSTAAVTPVFVDNLEIASPSPSGGGGSYDTVVAAIPGVVAFWRLQDASTSLLADSSGNGRDGFYNGSPTLRVNDAWEDGASDGFCVDFAGLGYGEVPHHASFELAAGTLSLYFRCGSLNDSAYVVTKDVSGLGAGQCTVRVETSGILRTHFKNGTNTLIIESAAGAVATGTWYHYLLTFDGTGFVVYLNNILIASQPDHTAGLIGNTVNWLFGRSPFANENRDIALDEVVLFNRVVTSSERAALAGLEAYTFTPGDLPGSALWLESDQGIVATSGRVSQWSDRLGTNHFVQTTNAEQPFLLSDQLAGHPAIDFRGAELLLSTLSSQDIWPIDGGSAAEVWMVFAISSLPSSGQAHMFSINQNSTTNALQIRWLSSAFQIAYRTASGLSSFGTTAPALNSYQLVRLRKDAATVTGYLAGTQFGQATDARTHVLTGGVVTPLVIGGREGLTNMMNGKVVFAWAGNQLLSTQEAVDLRSYIQSKYGV